MESNVRISSKEHASVVKGKSGSGKEASKAKKKNVSMASQAVTAVVADAYVGIKNFIVAHQYDKCDNGKNL